MQLIIWKLLRDKEDEEIEANEKIHSYNRCPSRVRDYSHRFTFLSIKAGQKGWGTKAKDALLDELQLVLE
jgi:hypothetical protein